MAGFLQSECGRGGLPLRPTTCRVSVCVIVFFVAARCAGAERPFVVFSDESLDTLARSATLNSEPATTAWKNLQGGSV